MPFDSKQTKRLFLAALIIILPVLGYVIMRGMTESFDNDGTASGEHAITYILLIAVALAIPFIMLKSVFKSAHMGDRHEPEIELKDIPKDKEQIARKS